MIYQQHNKQRFIVYHILYNDGTGMVHTFTAVQLAAYKRSKAYKATVLHLTKLVEVEIAASVKVHNLHSSKK